MSKKQHEVDELLEEQHFQHVKDAFFFYHSSAQQQLDRRQNSYDSLPQNHKDLIPTLKNRLIETRRAIDENYKLVRNIIKSTNGMFSNSPIGNLNKKISYKPLSSNDMSRVQTTLKQLVRDWSEEGKNERDQSYGPILNELEELYPSTLFNRSNIFVVVPGAGLGRLMFDIADRGFNCQGNEFSMYMLFASNFMLNVCKEVESYHFYPWIHDTCNVLSNNDQLRVVRIPDVCPSIQGRDLNFSMAAGDFLDVYSSDSELDCCVMCFFLDTAHNPIIYINKVYEILKPGGYWINFGPLLYHFSDTIGEMSVELTYDELMNVILSKFTLIKESIGLKAGYVQNCKSMMKTEYECVFFVVQKPVN